MTDRTGTAPVHRSVSTWQQPTPATVSTERSALVGSVAESVLRCGSGRLRVGVDGYTAAGKTTFGHELAEYLSAAGRPVLRASLDDFKRPWRERHRYDRDSGPGYYRNAFDYDGVRSLLLEPAGPDGSGTCVLCALDPLTQRDHTGVVTEAPFDAVLVVDGVFALRPEINAYWDFRIWLDIDPACRSGAGPRATAVGLAPRPRRSIAIVTGRPSSSTSPRWTPDGSPTWSSTTPTSTYLVLSRSHRPTSRPTSEADRAS